MAAKSGGRGEENQEDNSTGHWGHLLLFSLPAASNLAEDNQHH